MADDARQPQPDLIGPRREAPAAEPEAAAAAVGSAAHGEPAAETMQLFALLRRLERDGRRFGGAGRPEREPARLGQSIRLGFATRDVAALRPATGKRPARVSIAAIGLMGPEGPLPLHITRWVLDRLSQRWHADGAGAGDDATADTTFADFADMLQHRALALYYRAWADNRPEVQAERSGGGRHGALISALAGIGLPGTGSDLDRLRLRHAPALGHLVEAPGRLTAFLADVVGAPVALGEFVGDWLDVPEGLQTRLGQAHAGLGRGAALGPRSFQRQTRIELRIGPLTQPAFAALLPGSAGFATLRAAASGLIGDGLDADIRLVLARGAAPTARLGVSRLGRTGWLAPHVAAEADDLRLPVRPRRAA